MTKLCIENVFFFKIPLLTLEVFFKTPLLNTLYNVTLHLAEGSVQTHECLHTDSDGIHNAACEPLHI